MTHSRTLFYTSLLGAMIIGTVGCGHNASFQSDPSQASQNVPPGPTPTPTPAPFVDNTPACEVNISQVDLSGNVNTFEFNDSFGLTFGYSPAGQAGWGGNASIKVTKADMDLSMIGTDPMSGGMIASTDVTSGQTSTTINTTIDFNQLSASPSFFFQTPLANVSLKALQSAVANIQTQTNSMAWVGRVLEQATTNELIINAGTNAGIQVGDTFNVYNVTNFWSGTPCSSNFLGSQENSSTPTAVIAITSVGTTTAFGTFVGTPGTHVLKGAEVKVLALSSPSPTRVLKKSAKLGTITSQNFALPSGGTFNFQSAINSQILQVLPTSGFFLNTN